MVVERTARMMASASQKPVPEFRKGQHSSVPAVTLSRHDGATRKDHSPLDWPRPFADHAAQGGFMNHQIKSAFQASYNQQKTSL